MICTFALTTEPSTANDMTSIKVKFKPGRGAEHPGNIVYRISRHNRSRTITSGYRLYASEWNATASIPSAQIEPHRKQYIAETIEGIRLDMDTLRHIVDRLTGSSLPFSAEDVAAEFIRFSREYSLFAYMEKQIDTLRDRGKPRTAEIYRTTLNSFRRFRCDNDVRIYSITPDMLRCYEQSMRDNGITPNTSSFYMRVLRAVYNRAAEEGRFENLHPFKNVYTGIDKTVKRAIPIPIISRIRSLPLSRHPKLDFARDMFMMSFFLRGMSFVDMAFLRKSDLAGGRVTYRRRKTGQQLTVGWTREMQAIVDKYPCNPTQYLLPIITRKDIDERQVYRNVSSAINSNLKKVAALVDSSQRLTMYCARHSWASAARAKGVPMSIISEGMGHDSEKTTRIYLASLDTSAIDSANTLIINSI